MKLISSFALSALGVAAMTATSGAIAKNERPIPVATETSAETLSAIPSTAISANRWLKQDVYDGSGNKIGEVEDLLVADGQIQAAIVSVGGFVGINEKHVAVPTAAIHAVERHGKRRLTLNTTKEVLKSAPGFKYDRNLETWTAA